MWDARRMAISERKMMPATVRRVRANFWRRLLERAAGLRPARGRRFRIANVADDMSDCSNDRSKKSCVLT